MVPSNHFRGSTKYDNNEAYEPHVMKKTIYQTIIKCKQSFRSPKPQLGSPKPSEEGPMERLGHITRGTHPRTGEAGLAPEAAGLKSREGTRGKPRYQIVTRGIRVAPRRRNRWVIPWEG